MAIMRGHEAVGRLMSALGIQGRCSRVVIDCRVGGLVHIYTRMVADEQDLDAVADAVAEPGSRAGEPVVRAVRGLEVDELGRVYVPVEDHARLVACLERIRAGVEFPAAEARVALEG